MSDETRDDILSAGLALLEDLAPKDARESMLGIQMVATHLLAMEYLSAAQHSELALEAKDYYMKHASKLMALYAKQFEALDKHRGRGQQHVVVEHVSVAAGGQAFVGALSKNGTALPAQDVAQPAMLASVSAPPLASTAAKRKVEAEQLPPRILRSKRKS